MKKLTDRILSVLSDIDAMRTGSDYEFGPFESTDFGEAIEWPNLAVSAQQLSTMMSGMKGLEWRAMLTVSLDHVTENDARTLEHLAESNSHPLSSRVLGYEYGFVIRQLTECASYREFKEAGFSEAVLELVVSAINLGFTNLELDSQGPVIKGMPTFDW